MRPDDVAVAVTARAHILNHRVDAAVTAAFMISVAIVLVAKARVWWLLLVGKRAAEWHEEPYVAVGSSEVVRAGIFRSRRNSLPTMGLNSFAGVRTTSQ